MKFKSSHEHWPLRGKFPHTPFAYIDCFTEAECDDFIRLMERFKSNEIKGQVQQSPEAEKNNVRDCFVNFMPTHEPSFQWIFERISKSTLNLNEQFYRYDVDEIETIQFTTYLGTQRSHYGQHLDHLSLGAVCRKLSCVVQLSDPNDYEGGELVLYLPNKTVVPKKRGTIIMFPSFTPHAVYPVTKGKRYSAVSWILGPPFK
tara:strand:- start:73 stop:678 length:606 start_codon:yes stop_codon:yes gene_type:complete